jgi:ABC-type dipeptide/oligopeptide/nickel transport system permease subunit
MKLLKQIFYFRGIKIGKKEKVVSRMTVTILLLPFLLLFGLLTYLLFSQLISNLYFLLVYISFCSSGKFYRYFYFVSVASYQILVF